MRLNNGNGPDELKRKWELLENASVLWPIIRGRACVLRLFDQALKFFSLLSVQKSEDLNSLEEVPDLYLADVIAHNDIHRFIFRNVPNSEPSI
jgi:hypothetical protein